MQRHHSKSSLGTLVRLVSRSKVGRQQGSNSTQHSASLFVQRHHTSWSAYLSLSTVAQHEKDTRGYPTRVYNQSLSTSSSRIIRFHHCNYRTQLGATLPVKVNQPGDQSQLSIPGSPTHSCQCDGPSMNSCEIHCNCPLPALVISQGLGFLISFIGSLAIPSTAFGLLPERPPFVASLRIVTDNPARADTQFRRPTPSARIVYHPGPDPLISAPV